ncbi:hypothetical protein HNQ35_002489 [Cerasibacillus quisquiliarum]|mgnify:CR=1 FL=1|uniref:Uncharacterized protein n=1 Tax=Cerasibacillus quisquiliarum TaxID=227865 RepID=A0A511UZT5_9BACI|nr:hypothetical protein [Cerasibacillus quisquiliarum]MBB5147271.1 hypothetical protein [Cerasibacillus quisquiliarum]GEN32160.1 hypothetical protein CQU01_23980 [Cerasibacillus quisquiliarum]
MNLYLIKHEMKWLMNSKKNILFIAFLFILLCSYVFIILPATESTETFDIDEKSYKVEDIRHSMDFRENWFF